LRQEPAPGRLATTRRALNHDPSIRVLDPDHRPRPAAEQEAAHTIDQPIHEALIERAEHLPVRRLDHVALRAREHRIQLHEVAPTKATLGLGPEQQPTAGLDQRAIVQHVCDQPITLRAMDPGQVRQLLKVLPRRVRGHAVVGQ
jgi:hypothetical protein